jgi:hypothetical protein
MEGRNFEDWGEGKEPGLVSAVCGGIVLMGALKRLAQFQHPHSGSLDT